MKLVEKTLEEIAGKTEILSAILDSSINKKDMMCGIAMDIMQTLILSEYKLKDESVSQEEKVELCDMLTLLFIQVTKLENLKKGEIK